MRKALPATLFLLALLLVPVLLLTTEGAARRVLDLVAREVGMEIDLGAGSLWGGLRIVALEWEDAGTKVRVEDLWLNPQWRWNCLLRSTLCLHEVAAGRVLVSSAPVADAPRDPFTLPDAIDLPVGLTVEHMSVGSLEIVGAGETLVFSNASASLALGSGILRVPRLGITTPQGDLDGRMRLTLGGDWALTTSLAVTLADGALAAELPRRWALSAEGPLRALSAELSTPDAQALTASLALRFPEGFDAVDADLDLRGAGELPTVAALYPWVQLSAPLAMSLRAGAGTPTPALTLQTRVAGYSDAPLGLRARLEFGAGDWTLDEFTLRDDSGTARLALSGSLGSPQAWDVGLSGNASDLRVPVPGDTAVSGVTGWLDAHLWLEGEQLRWELRDLDLEASLDGRAVALRGDLRGAPDQPLLPLGAADALVDELPLRYRRAESAPASLVLPDGLQWNDLSLATAELRVAPAATTAIDVALEGDVSVRLRLAITETGTGADWTLQPFEAELYGTAVKAREAMRGSWVRDARALRVDPFCWALRGSSLCTTVAELGESGSLRVQLEGDERIEGVVGGAPYALSAQGSGDLQLAWSALQFTEAVLALRLSQLELDPFIGPDTAEAVVFESVVIDARATPEQRKLTLLASSARAGVLRANVAQAEDALEGFVELESLSLPAFNDLVPELVLASGELGGRVDFSGTAAAPAYIGELWLRDGAVYLPEAELGLEDAQLDLSGTQEYFEVSGVASLGEGPISISGTCCSADAMQLEISGSRNRIRLPIGVDALVSPDISAFLTTDSAVVRGEIAVHEGLYELTGPLAEGVSVSDDFVRVDRAVEAPHRFDLDADLRARIADGFTLRSTQIEATLGGDLRLLAQSGSPPQLFGEMRVLGGVFRAYGQGLRLERGSVGFVGDPLNPDIDLSAVREIRAEQLRVGVRARGTLESPQLKLFSEPQRSERVTLSYLLRGRGPDAGAGADGTAMALALGASALNQSGVLENLNSIPGLSEVSIGAEGSDNDAAATISAYVGDRLYLSYGMGIYEPVSTLTARLYLRSRLWLEVVSRLENSVDLYYRFDRE